MHPLSSAVRQFILDIPQVKRVLVACSGGVDSTVLLHCVAKAQLGRPVVAVHVNHQLSPNADAWQQYVQNLCAELKVPCLHQRVEVKSKGSGVEQAARRARYSVFERHLQEGDLLLTAHHRQDQAETFFLRLCRGAGLRGLGAMAPIRPHKNARLARPFLHHAKEQLEAYAHAHQLDWVEDESNKQQVFDRNFLRAQVMPLLQQRWPQVFQQIFHSTQLLQEAESLLSLYAEQDLVQCEPRHERVGRSIRLTPLLKWPEARRNHVFRTWLAGQGVRLPEHKQLTELTRLMTAQADKSPLLLWQDCEIRRYQQRLYCLPKHWQQSLEAAQALPAGLPLTDDKCATLFATRAQEGLAPGRSYTVRLRKHCPQVSRAHPYGRSHSQTLKKLLQEYALEPWLRPWLPLVLCDDELVAVADLWVENAHNYRGEQALALCWQPARQATECD